MAHRILASVSTLLFLLYAIQDGVCTGRFKRVVGGSDAAPKEFPYQVSLRFDGIHICGGTLISKQHVLSAAHCVCELLEPPYEELTVTTGTNEIKSAGLSHKVVTVTCHPEFVFGVKNSWTHDLVVLTLNDSIVETEWQKPIDLATCNTPADVSAVLSGWGRFSVHGFLANKLQKVSLTTLENKNCQSYYPKNKILSSHLCTFQGKGIGACKGDSGSPLVYNNELVGVFSWTTPCATGSPDVYSRIYDFRDFILLAMNDTSRNEVVCP